MNPTNSFSFNHVINGMHEPISPDTIEVLRDVFGEDDEDEAGASQQDLTSVLEAQLPIFEVQARVEDITNGRRDLARILAPTLSPYLPDILNPEFQRYYRSTGLTRNFS